MSRENVEIVRQAYDALSRKDLHEVLDAMHPNLEATSYILEADGAIYRGREGMRQLIEDIWSVFPDYSAEVVSPRSVGDAVIAEIRSTGRAVGSGLAVEGHAWQVVRVRDGMAVWMHPYRTEAEALEAAGLRE